MGEKIVGGGKNGGAGKVEGANKIERGGKEKPKQVIKNDNRQILIILFLVNALTAQKITKTPKSVNKQLSL